MSISPIIATLAARLPELERKLESMAITLSAQTIPRGVFKTSYDQLSPSTCLAEIKADLFTLAQSYPFNQQSTNQYLSQRIQQKIKVLVGLCRLQAKQASPKPQKNWGMPILSTRRQWLQTQQEILMKLTTQVQALTEHLQSLPTTCNSPLRLNLQAELGALQEQKTRAEEELNRATRW